MRGDSVDSVSGFKTAIVLKLDRQDAASTNGVRSSPFMITLAVQARGCRNFFISA
jgi:hypothetical protein